MKIGVLVAMDKEYEQLCGLANENIIIRKTGIGKVNAAVNATLLINECHPDIIVSSGCAGGASAQLDVMDVVVSTQIAYHDVYCAVEGEEYGRVQGLPRYFESPKSAVDIALSLRHTGKIHSGLIASGDWLVDTTTKMREILDIYPQAIAIDMESAALAHTCYLFNTPFVSFRVISDVPIKENSISQYNNFWETVSDNSFSITRQFLQTLLQ